MADTKIKLFEPLFYIFLCGLVLLLFYRFTIQNTNRIQEQSIAYANDSASQIADNINDQLENSQNLIRTYAYFLENTMSGPEVNIAVLRELEKNSPFDAIMFTDAQGINHATNGQSADKSYYDFHKNGMEGKSGVGVEIDSSIHKQTILGFYTPLHFNGKIVGVLSGIYLSDKFLQAMLATSYFGMPTDVFLCLPTGQIIASSSNQKYAGDILELLARNGTIDVSTAVKAADVFKNGGQSAFACNENSKVDNICIMHLPDYNYVLVQTFPQQVTSGMINNANRAGFELEAGLLVVFACYAAFMIFRYRRQKKELERENREFGFVITGLNTLFSSRYCMADLETGRYDYIGKDATSNIDLPQSGPYEDFVSHYANLLIAGEIRDSFLKFFQKDNLVKTLDRRDSAPYLCHVIRDRVDKWENLTAVCLERKNGRASRILFVRQDVTAMKKREMAAQQKLMLMDRKERQYQLAISSNALCSYEFNVSKDILAQNITLLVDGKPLSMLAIKGLAVPCAASEYFSASLPDILPESKDEYAKIASIKYLLERFDAGQQEVDLEYWRRIPLGDEICVRQTFYLTRDDSSGDIMALTVVRNITSQVIKQRSQTKALKDALLLAQHANEAKTTFLSNMSHDIRTPMNAIIGFATIAAGHLDNKNQVSDCLRKVLASSNHLLSLINDILDMSRIESGKMQIKEQECNISELMHNLVNIIQPQVRAKQMQLFIDTFEVVNENVITDPLKLNQVFINLLSNAVKYTPAGGTIAFRLCQKPAFKHGFADYIFEVKDNGRGMSPDFVKHIFEPFARETTSTRSGIQGTGLGMAITKNIIDMLNGHIEVVNNPGKGSTFIVTLTLKLQEAGAQKSEIKALEGMRALVVDDDFHVCDSVDKMLRKIGMRPEWTTSGREAVYRAQIAHDDEDSFHTFIIDWQMPGMDGIETARKIRNIVGKDAPIIILTAYEWTDIELEAREAGVTAFCAKPLFMSDLKNALLSSHNLLEKTDSEQAGTANFHGARILVVDDLEMNREIAEFILTENGFAVECAPDGTDAVELVRNSEEGHYEAILMDVQMPTMDGYEATMAIRAMQREDVKTMPIIAMTANAMEEDKAKALQCGMNDHISKPIEMKNFFGVLEKFFHKS